MNKDGLQKRIIISLGLVILAIIIWLTANPEPFIWLINVSSGLVVLGLAGIWVSYFAELEAAKKIKNDIDTRFSLLSTLLKANVNNAYYHEDQNKEYSCRQEDLFKDRILQEISSSHDEIRIIAVAAREFLHAGDGFAYSAIDHFLQRQGKINSNPKATLRIILLHPMCEPAVSRAFREDIRFTDFSDYGKTRLWNDINQSFETLLHWKLEKYRVAASAYKVVPACFLLFVNDIVYVEQYHFGEGRERASGKVPIFEVVKGSNYYDQLEGHFEHVWKIASSCEITETFLKGLNPADTNFQKIIEYTHHNIHNLSYADISNLNSE